MSAEISSPWRWVALPVVLAVHDRQVAEHGGTSDVRDLGMLKSALAHPTNLSANGDPDIAELAAAYAFGLARNHGVADGKKRTAWVTACVFLADNDQNLEFDPFDAVRTMEEVVGGGISESELASWFRSRIEIEG